VSCELGCTVINYSTHKELDVKLHKPVLVGRTIGSHYYIYALFCSYIAETFHYFIIRLLLHTRTFTETPFTVRPADING